MIINKNIGDIPYIVIVVIIPLMLGIIFGLSYGISVRQRFQRIHHQLDDIVKGQELIRNDYSPYNELDDIQISLEKIDRKSTRLNSSHVASSYAAFCLKKRRKTRCPAASRL